MGIAMKTIIRNIDCLVTCRGEGVKKGSDMMDAGIINDGYVVIDAGRIAAVGEGEGYREHLKPSDLVIDGAGKTVTPGLIDGHTHLVYAGSREFELPLKLAKVGYIDILKAGGGILSSVRDTRAASREELVLQARKRLDLMLTHGTTTVESKSGYGLDLETEMKMLRANRLLNDSQPVDIVSTFMGAHAVPQEYKEDREGYIRLIVEEMLPKVREENLAEFADCFCEHGVFDIEETRRILTAARAQGFKIKLHADEVVSTGGAELAGEMKAVSAEHLVAASQEGMKAMADNNVIAILLPTTSFYLMLEKFADARKMIELGVPVALATDCNPGTSPTESLQIVMTYACFGLRMMPEEIINAVTLNAACSIGREKEIGSIEAGKKADLVIFDAKNLNYLIYHFGVNAVDTVIKDGNIVVKGGLKC
ncbi:MAG: imidazolonepropionase [Firmicutes bacterium]|nr:imidazolonepropionase [Bacillota bacterium]